MGRGCLWGAFIVSLASLPGVLPGGCGLAVSRSGLAVSGVFAAWLVFEVVMAFVLRDRFEARDWLALVFKLSYLSLMVWAGLRGVPVAAGWGACLGPLFSGLVRSTGGWLAYTFFTVYLPAIGLAGALYLGLRAPAAVNALALAVAGLGLLVDYYPLDALLLLALGAGGLAYCRSRLYAAITRPSKSL